MNTGVDVVSRLGRAAALSASSQTWFAGADRIMVAAPSLHAQLAAALSRL